MVRGITSNVLKIIAIIIMVIDHIAFYMYKDFNYNDYYILRCIGRMAMPIFAYLLVQGFFYTNNLKKYIFRIFLLANVTQLFLFILGLINKAYYPNYPLGIINYLAVLYSYTFSLILITVIDRKIIIKTLSKKENLFARVLLFIFIILIYLTIKVEFNMQIPVMIMGLYGIEKFFQKDNKLLLKNENTITKRIAYVMMIAMCFLISIAFLEVAPGNKFAILLSALIIALYNGERGEKNKFIQYLFYAIFPIQHIALYLLAMIS